MKNSYIPLSIIDINYWNNSVVLAILKEKKKVNWNNRMWHANPVFSRSAFSNLTCQQPDFKSEEVCHLTH